VLISVRVGVIGAEKLEPGWNRHSLLLGRLRDLWWQLFYPVQKPLMWERTGAIETSHFPTTASRTLCNAWGCAPVLQVALEFMAIETLGCTCFFVM